MTVNHDLQFLCVELIQIMMPNALISTFLTIIVLTIIVPSAYADIFRYVDENGRVVYSSERPISGPAAKKVTIRDNSVSSGLANTGVAAKDVVIYTASWCGICKTAKAYFNEQGIDFEEFDIDRNPRGKRDFARLGGRAVPVILVGDQRMNGFDAARFQVLYQAEY